MKILPYLFLFCLVTACGPSVKERKDAVDTAFADYQKVPADSSAQKLVTTLADYSSSKARIEDKNIAADTILKFIALNMFNDSTFRLNEPRARLYIDACEAAVKAEPALAKAPEYLHHAAETARTLRDIPKAALGFPYDFWPSIGNDRSGELERNSRLTMTDRFRCRPVPDFSGPNASNTDLS